MSVQSPLDCERPANFRKSLNLRDIFLALRDIFD